MFRFLRQPTLVVFLIFTPLLAAPAFGASAQQIQDALDKGRAYLLSAQKAGGHWETADSRVGTGHDWPTMQGDTFGGYTALCTDALLSSGSTATDPKIVAAVNFLKKADIVGVYAIGLRLQVWLQMWQQTGDAQYRALASADAAKLVTWLGQNTGDNAGLWNYLGKGDRIDHSVSQYGVLGLWAAAQMGGEIPDTTWRLIDQTWRAGQFKEGGWGYSSTPAHMQVGDTGKPSMTAAGIATLFLTQEYLHGNDGLNCDPVQPNDAIENGLDWMTRNFAQVNDPYTFYGIERIGVACGYKYFGTVDWFSQIADRLVSSQGADGSFGSGLGEYPGESPLCATAFGVLFLARGGAPVMMNKLDYSHVSGHGMRDAHWNQRPRDAFNLARWTGVEAEAANLNWQVVNLGVSVDDFHDSPILYMTGDQVIDLPPGDVVKLRQFVAEGGMILGNADCESTKFSHSFEVLGTKLFPKYEFRELGRDHLIYTGETYRPNKMRGFQPIMGLSNGVRELMLVFTNGDPDRRWQSNSTMTNSASFQIGSDIFQYATDIKGLRKKGDSYIVRPDNGSTTQTVTVARLMVGNNPDPEPGGWPRLSAILHNQPFGTQVTVTPVKSGDDLAGKYQIVHLTGTTAFTLQPAEQQILKDFVAKGGTIIIDAAGGSGVFANSADAALLAMYPKEAAKGLARALPIESPVYAIPNATITTVEYRRFARHNMIGSYKAPHLRGIEIAGRLAIFYSREDLSAGMVGEEVDGINGYSPASATAIMRNLVLFVAQQPK